MISTRLLASLLAVPVASVALGGCYYGFDSSSSGRAATPPSSVSTPSTTWTAQTAQYAGDMGSVRGFGSVPGVVQGTDGGSTSVVRIDAEDTSARWWAMTRLTVEGTLSHPMLVPGAHLVFTPSGGAMTSAGVVPLFVHAIGCSGPRRDDYTFDQPASQITVDVDAGPDATSRTITFMATFAPAGGTPQHVTGSFVYSAP